MSAGFYKFEGGAMHYGPNFVLNSDYELRLETKDEHEYPVDGWYWFYSQEEAHSFFKINEKIKEVEEENIN
jgi:hypothetical protein